MSENSKKGIIRFIGARAVPEGSSAEGYGEEQAADSGNPDAAKETQISTGSQEAEAQRPKRLSRTG